MKAKYVVKKMLGQWDSGTVLVTKPKDNEMSYIQPVWGLLCVRWCHFLSYIVLQNR